MTWHGNTATQVAFITGCSVPTRNWFYKGFLPRHPEIKMIKPQSRDKAHNDVPAEIKVAYQDELEKNLLALGL